MIAEHRLEAPCVHPDDDVCAVLAWARSGAMALTGRAGGPPLAPRPPVTARLHAVAGAIADESARVGDRVEIDVPVALTGRAARLGLTRHGRRSPAGSCRLLRAADGWVAINLARAADVAAIPAVVEAAVRDGDAWPALGAFAARTPAELIAARCQLLGIPSAPLRSGPAPHRPVQTIALATPALAPACPPGAALVVDLSAMWAGPLCAHILGRAGCRVIKVEDTRRPDGARAGDGAFYDWLHAGHESVAVDWSTRDGVRALHALVARAEIVIEASRPRALAQLGIDAEAVVRARPGVTWVSITGYGRSGDDAGKVAFGDDAAIAGGLVAFDADGAPVFAGDAIADPATGMYAAREALRSHAAGGGNVVELTMAGVAAALAAPHASQPSLHTLTREGRDWTVHCEAGGTARVAFPRPLEACGTAEPLGASTARVVAELEVEVEP